MEDCQEDDHQLFPLRFLNTIQRVDAFIEKNVNERNLTEASIMNMNVNDRGQQHIWME